MRRRQQQHRGGSGLLRMHSRGGKLGSSFSRMRHERLSTRMTGNTSWSPGGRGWRMVVVTGRKRIERERGMRTLGSARLNPGHHVLWRIDADGSAGKSLLAPAPCKVVLGYSWPSTFSIRLRTTPSSGNLCEARCRQQPPPPGTHGLKRL